MVLIPAQRGRSHGRRARRRPSSTYTLDGCAVRSAFVSSEGITVVMAARHDVAPRRTRSAITGPGPSKRLVGLRVGAEYLDCTTRSLRVWISQGRITGYRVGRHIKVDLIELDQFATPIPAAG